MCYQYEYCSVVTVPATRLYIHQLGLEQDSIWLQQGVPQFHADCLGGALPHLSDSSGLFRSVSHSDQSKSNL